MYPEIQSFLETRLGGKISSKFDDTYYLQNEDDNPSASILVAMTYGRFKGSFLSKVHIRNLDNLQLQNVDLVYIFGGKLWTEKEMLKAINLLVFL